MIRDKAWHHHLPGALLGMDKEAVCDVIYRSGERETGYCSQLNWIDGGIIRYRVVEQRMAKGRQAEDVGKDI